MYNNSGTITYRYKKGNPISWQVPISSMMVPKEVEIEGKTKSLLKKVAYYEGSSSIFVEDNQKSDVPKKNIWLTDQGNGYTELYVPKENTLLHEILQKNPKFNVDFEVHDADASANKQLEEFELKEKALDYLSDADDIKIRAIAFAICGYSAFTWTEKRAMAEMKKRAFETPKVILDKINEKDYEAKIIAGQAYHQGIIESDATETKVIWTDSGETIVGITSGQLGVEKMAEFLSVRSSESLSVLQRIGAILNHNESSSFESSNTDALEEARTEYKNKTGKDVPNLKRNDLAWLKAKSAD